MDADFWIERWEQGRTGFHQQEINPWLQRYITSLHLPSGARIFVPLAGKSRDMLWLAEQGYRVLGVEVSGIAVEQFFADNRLVPDIQVLDGFTSYRSGSIELLLGDFFRLERSLLHDVGGVYDRASLVALPQEMRRRYAEHLKDLLPGQARMLLLTFEYAEGARQGPPFSVSVDEVHDLFSDTFSISVLDERVDGIGGMTEKVMLLERDVIR